MNARAIPSIQGGNRGHQGLIQPAIEVHPPDNWREVDDATDRLADFQWVVFSSANGVRFFCGRLAARGLDARMFATCRLAATANAEV